MFGGAKNILELGSTVNKFHVGVRGQRPRDEIFWVYLLCQLDLDIVCLTNLGKGLLPFLLVSDYSCHTPWSK